MGRRGGRRRGRHRRVGLDGGDPVTRDEGGKMIRPDSPVTPSSRGITVECYDGKTRELKLQN